MRQNNGIIWCDYSRNMVCVDCEYHTKCSLHRKYHENLIKISKKIVWILKEANHLKASLITFAKNKQKQLVIVAKLKELDEEYQLLLLKEKKLIKSRGENVW